MDPNSLLADRLQALRERLESADAAVGAAAALVSTIAEERKQVEGEIPQARASAEAWHSLAVREETDKALFKEVLAHLQAQGRAALPDSGPDSWPEGGRTCRKHSRGRQASSHILDSRRRSRVIDRLRCGICAGSRQN